MFQYTATDRQEPRREAGEPWRGRVSHSHNFHRVRFPSLKERKGHQSFHSLSVSLLCKWNKNESLFTFWIVCAFPFNVLTSGPYFFSTSKYVKLLQYSVLEMLKLPSIKMIPWRVLKSSYVGFGEDSKKVRKLLLKLAMRHHNFRWSILVHSSCEELFIVVSWSSEAWVKSLVCPVSTILGTRRVVIFSFS